MTISIIVAIAKNNVIGKDNKLIWHISDDLKRFKILTSGKPIIMGRKTYESLPFKPLPKRKNIVVSSQNIEFEGAIVVNSFENALAECDDNDEVFICGGASVYEHFLLIADKIYFTFINKEYDGDTFFPDIDMNEWKVVFNSGHLYDEKSGLDYSFLNLISQKEV